MGVLVDGERLFGAGPVRCVAGGRELRADVQGSLGATGGRVVSSGIRARRIVQRGALVADSPGELRALAERVEAKLDGLARTLTDEHGRAWERVVLTRFEPGEVVRVGARWKQAYEAVWVQSG